MSWSHFRTFVWLRWRLRMNQLRRGGIANTILLVLVAVALVGLGLGLFAGCLIVGLLALPAMPQEAAIFVWDGLIVLFLFFWSIGLLTDLQRSEALALDKILHLPVSLSGAFTINYLSSLISITLMLFLPPMLGLTLAVIITYGFKALLVLPLLCAFIFMVTALTYQFQGWLASLMANKRRRQTIIVVVTIGFILLCQAPNLFFNVLQPWKDEPRTESAQALAEKEALRQAVAEGKLSQAEFQKKEAELKKAQKEQNYEAGMQKLRSLAATTRWINLVLPPGWLPLGAVLAVEGSAWPALLGTLGMSLIGAASLYRGYHTTLRIYTGAYSSGKVGAVPSSAPRPAEKPISNLVERQLPWLDEQTSAVALATFRGMLRAPEVKMMCIGPIILVIVFGAMFFTKQMDVPLLFRPLLAFAGLFMVFVCAIQLVGNQFGWDRGGFRMFVLSPAPRRRILLGKNLAFAPLLLGLGACLMIVLQVLAPLRLTDVLALFPLALSMFLLFCMQANLLAILVPLRIAPGAFKPANTPLVPVLMQLAFFMIMPAVLSLALVPFLLAMLLEWTRLVGPGWPIALVLGVLECAVVVLAYRMCLDWEGELFHERELAILEKVVAKES